MASRSFIARWPIRHSLDRGDPVEHAAGLDAPIEDVRHLRPLPARTPSIASSPRSLTISVAPDSRASRTAAITPGRTRAQRAAWCPVPITSDSVSSDGIRGVIRPHRQRDQRIVLRDIAQDVPTGFASRRFAYDSVPLTSPQRRRFRNSPFRERPSSCAASATRPLDVGSACSMNLRSSSSMACASG